MLDLKNISNNGIKQKIIIKNKDKIFKKEESYKGLQKYIYLSGIPNKINMSPQKILIMLVLIDIIGSIVGFLINKKIGIFLGIILLITQYFIISNLYINYSNNFFCIRILSFQQNEKKGY